MRLSRVLRLQTALLLGVEPRIKASVMIAGFPALTLDYSRGDRRAAVAFRGLFAAAAGGSPETSLFEGGHFALGSGAPREERRTFLVRSLAPPQTPSPR